MRSAKSKAVRPRLLTVEQAAAAADITVPQMEVMIATMRVWVEKRTKRGDEVVRWIAGGEVDRLIEQLRHDRPRRRKRRSTH